MDAMTISCPRATDGASNGKLHESMAMVPLALIYCSLAGMISESGPALVYLQKTRKSWSFGQQRFGRIRTSSKQAQSARVVGRF